MKKLAKALIMVSVFVAVDAYAQATSSVMVARATKVAYIEPQGVIAKSDQWKEDVEKAQKEFERRVTDLQKQKEEFNQRAKNPASSAEREVAKDLAKKKNDIEIEERSLQMELQQMEQELQQRIAQKVEAAIKVVRVAQGWDAIEPKVFDINPDFDITNAVAEQMNKDYKKERAAAKLKKDAAKAPTPAEKK